MPGEPDLCRCGHVREAHEHYRRGSDCGICGMDGCRRFTAAVRDTTTPESSRDTLTRTARNAG